MHDTMVAHNPFFCTAGSWCSLLWQLRLLSRCAFRLAKIGWCLTRASLLDGKSICKSNAQACVEVTVRKLLQHIHGDTLILQLSKKMATPSPLQYQLQILMCLRHFAGMLGAAGWLCVCRRNGTACRYSWAGAQARTLSISANCLGLLLGRSPPAAWLGKLEFRIQAFVDHRSILVLTRPPFCSNVAEATKNSHVLIALSIFW